MGKSEESTDKEKTLKKMMDDFEDENPGAKEVIELNKKSDRMNSEKRSQHRQTTRVTNSSG